MSINPFEDESLALPEEQPAEEPFYQDEVLEDQEPELAAEEEVDAQLSNAMQRIEQAQLYKLLLTNSPFAEGSARPEIQRAVEQELRAFATERLEILVGVRQERQEAVQAPSPFSDQEVTVLKALANRYQQKASAPKEPNPQISQVAATPASAPASPSRPKLNPVRPAGQVKPLAKAASKPAGKTAPRRRSKSVSKFDPNKDYSQATSPKALPMPTIAQQNSQAAAQAHKASMGIGGGDKGQLLNILTQMSLEKNKHVGEE